MINLCAIWRKGKCIITTTDMIRPGDLLKKPIKMDELIGITTEKIKKGDLIVIENGLISRAERTSKCNT